MTVVERSNRRQLMTRGEVSQERREHAERLAQEFERLRSLTEQMSEALGEEMVELPKLETEKVRLKLIGLLTYLSNLFNDKTYSWRHNLFDPITSMSQ